MTTPQNTQTRYHLLDALRGFTLIHMILFHLIYDLRYIFGLSLPWYGNTLDHIWQQCICFTFILLSGISWNFGRHPFKRGAFVFGCGFVITLVTVLVMPAEAVWFGVLTLLGSCMLLLIPLQPLVSRLHPWTGLAGSILLFIFTRHLGEGWLGFGSAFRIPLPDFLYQGKFMAYLGFPYPAFTSSDYFPLFPWFFLFLTGYFFWNGVKNQPEFTRRLTVQIPFLDGLGKHSIWIYMLHQPVLMLVLELWFWLHG